MKEKWISIVRLFWISKSRRFMVAAPTVTHLKMKKKHFRNYVSLQYLLFFHALSYIDINSKHTLIKTKTYKQQNETRSEFWGKKKRRLYICLYTSYIQIERGQVDTNNVHMEDGI